MSERSDYEIVIKSDDKDFSVSASASLKQFMDDEDYSSQIKLTQKRKDLEKDEAGGAFLPIIELLAGSQVVGAIIEGLFTWLKSLPNKKEVKDNKLTIDIKKKDGQTVSIDYNIHEQGDMDFVNELVDKLTS